MTRQNAALNMDKLSIVMNAKVILVKNTNILMNMILLLRITTKKRILYYYKSVKDSSKVALFRKGII